MRLLQTTFGTDGPPRFTIYNNYNEVACILCFADDRMFGGPPFPLPMSQPFPGAPNGPIGSKGPRGSYKGNNVLLSNATQDRLINNLSSLAVNANKVQVRLYCC